MVFKLDPHTQDWETRAAIRGHTVKIRAHPASEHKRLAASAITRVEKARDSIQQNILRSVYPLYKRTWADPEPGFTALRAEEFLGRIKLERVSVLGQEGALWLSFNDSALFGGHWVEIFWNSDGKMYNAGLAT